jgi:hypothetical protein
MMAGMGLLGAPSWSALALAAAGWALVAFVPGALVVAALDPWRSWAVRLAVAPLVSTALAFGVASWTGVLGVRWAPWQCVVVLVVASLVAAAVLVRRRRAASTVHVDGRPPSPTVRRDVLVVAASSAAATVVWLAGLALSKPGGSAVLPQADGVTHGLLTTRMLLLGTVDPYRLNVTDLAETAYRDSFYPVAFHVLAATVTQVAEVASTLLVAVTMVASVWSVLGVFALTAVVAGRRAARRASVASAVLVPGVLVANLWWGSFTTMLATAAVPGLLAALLAVRRGRGRLVAALAVSGLLCAHTTEALLALGVCLLAILLEPRAGRRWRLALPGLGVVVLGALAMSAPTVRLLLAPGGADRPQEGSRELATIDAVVRGLLVPLQADTPSADALGLASVLGAVVVAALASAGAWRLRGTGAGRALALVVVALLALSVAAYARPVGLLGWPWYGNAQRIGTAAATFLPMLVGAGWLAVELRARSAGRGRAAAVRAVVAVAAAGLAAQSVVAVAAGVDEGSVVTPDTRAAFAWLEQRVGPGERVLNDGGDGSLWAYASTGGAVRTVFGAKPGGGFEADPELADRVHLRDHVADIATDERARRAAQEWDVRYVIVSEPTMADLTRRFDPARLAAAPGVREVFRSGDAVVYELPRS